MDTPFELQIKTKAVTKAKVWKKIDPDTKMDSLTKKLLENEIEEIKTNNLNEYVNTILSTNM